MFKMGGILRSSVQDRLGRLDYACFYSWRFWFFLQIFKNLELVPNGAMYFLYQDDLLSIVRDEIKGPRLGNCARVAAAP
jgi:hypothetical protein